MHSHAGGTRVNYETNFRRVHFPYFGKFHSETKFFFFAENDRGISKVVELLEFKSPMPENLFLEMVMNNLANEIKGNLILATFLF